MKKPERHVWEDGSTHRSIAGKEYDDVWDYADALRGMLAEWLNRPVTSYGPDNLTVRTIALLAEGGE